MGSALLSRGLRIGKRGTKLVEQPTMSLSRGNGLFSSKGNGVYPTQEAALKANNIPLQEEAIWFTYEGKDRLRGYRSWGAPKGGALDHPFIVMGDSQARQNSHRGKAPVDGGGILNQLSARLGILGTVLSMNGDVDRVPPVFVENELPQVDPYQGRDSGGPHGGFLQ